MSFRIFVRRLEENLTLEFSRILSCRLPPADHTKLKITIFVKVISSSLESILSIDPDYLNSSSYESTRFKKLFIIFISTELIISLHSFRIIIIFSLKNERARSMNYKKYLLSIIFHSFSYYTNF